MRSIIRLIIFFVLCLILSFSQMESQEFTKKTGNFQLNFGFMYKAAGAFYDINGKFRVDQIDSFKINRNDSTLSYIKKYVYDYKNYTLLLGGDYNLSKDITISAEIPLMLNSLVEDYSIDTNSISPDWGQKVVRGDFSFLLPEYYKFGIKYNLDSLGNIGVFSNLSIPPTFKNGYQNDTSTHYYYYSAYQWKIGSFYRMQFEKSWLGASVLYNLRGGGFSDQLVAHIEGGFSTVPNTSLRAFLDIYNNLRSFDNAVKFDQRYTTFDENIIDLGFAFRFMVGKDFFSEMAYSVRLGSKNTMSLGQFSIKGGILF